MKLRRRTFLKSLAFVAGACLMRIVPELAPPMSDAAYGFRRDIEALVWFPVALVYTRHPNSLGITEQVCRSEV